MRKTENNYAFIDAQNLYMNVRVQGWMLDLERFKIYLQEKYQVTRAYIFIGYLQENTSLYASFQKAGYVCVFKPTLAHDNSPIKGNCDAELVLQSMIDYSTYDKAVIITGDGDFYCLAKYLAEHTKLKALFIPNRYRFSALLKIDLFKPYLRYVNDLKNKLAYIKKNPHKDDTL